MNQGNTFLSSYYDNHLWVVVSNHDNGKVVIVNLTTFNHMEEDYCILEPGDHPFVIHKTAVRYKDAKIAKVSDLKLALEKGLLKTRESVNNDVLNKIILGFKKSVFVPMSCKNFLSNQGLALQEQKFKLLSNEWKRETRFQSNILTKSMHHSYQKIIGMGEASVPFILNDMIENGPNDWFWALASITDENPITNEIAGNMIAMTEAWLQWGAKAGYLENYQKKMKNVLHP